MGSKGCGQQQRALWRTGVIAAWVIMVLGTGCTPTAETGEENARSAISVPPPGYVQIAHSSTKVCPNWTVTVWVPEGGYNCFVLRTQDSATEQGTTGRTCGLEPAMDRPIVYAIQEEVLIGSFRSVDVDAILVHDA